MSIPNNIVVKINTNNLIPPVIKVNNKIFRTEVK